MVHAMSITILGYCFKHLLDELAVYLLASRLTIKYLYVAQIAVTITPYVELTLNKYQRTQTQVKVFRLLSFLNFLQSV